MCVTAVNWRVSERTRLHVWLVALACQALSRLWQAVRPFHSKSPTVQFKKFRNALPYNTALRWYSFDSLSSSLATSTATPTRLFSFLLFLLVYPEP